MRQEIEFFVREEPAADAGARAERRCDRRQHLVFYGLRNGKCRAGWHGAAVLEMRATATITRRKGPLRNATILITYGGYSSVAEHRSVAPGVVGSIPTSRPNRTF